MYGKLGGWISRAPTEHPMVKVNVYLCTSGYRDLDIPLPRVTHRTVNRVSMADMGAQMVVGSIEPAHALGITKKELIPLDMKANVANGAEPGMIGGILVKTTMTENQGKKHESQQLCYINSLVHTFYLSKEVCEDLGLVNKEFPNGTTAATIKSMAKPSASRPCSCPHRSLPPPPTTTLPYPPTKENSQLLSNVTTIPSS